MKAQPLKVVLHRIGEPAPTQKLDSPELVREFWRNVIACEPGFEPEKEHLVVLFLNTKLRCTGYHVVSMGSLNESIAHPREVFRPAIVAGAYGIVLAHNHPSGDPSPSGADLAVTRRMEDAGKLLDIKVFDHVIVGSGQDSCPSFYSFKENSQL